MKTDRLLFLFSAEVTRHFAKMRMKQIKRSHVTGGSRMYIEGKNLAKNMERERQRSMR